MVLSLALDNSMVDSLVDVLVNCSFRAETERTLCYDYDIFFENHVSFYVQPP